MKPLGKLLDASDELKALRASTRRLATLQALYAKAAPAELAAATHVKDLRAGTLLIGADNAAVASKLRQVAPRLVGALGALEPSITALKVELTLSRTWRRAERPSSKAALDATALARFEEVSRRLPESGLKRAVLRRPYTDDV